MRDLAFESQDGVSLMTSVVEPPRPDSQTGMLLWLHGWSRNRFQYDFLPELAQRFNVSVVSPEWRGCGYACDPVGGEGICQPYDYSYLQLIDCLNAFRAARATLQVNDRRLFAWGGGQGGHIAALLAAFAPRTFAVVCSLAGFSYVDPEREPLLGWELQRSDYEIRDARRFADRIRSRVWLIHGELDDSVPIRHAYELEAALLSAGADVQTRYFKGADHFLAPDSDRRRASLDCLTEDLTRLTTQGHTELATEEQVELPCTDGTYVIEYGRSPIVVRFSPKRCRTAGGSAALPRPPLQ